MSKAFSHVYPAKDPQTMLEDLDGIVGSCDVDLVSDSLSIAVDRIAMRYEAGGLDSTSSTIMAALLLDRILDTAMFPQLN